MGIVCVCILLCHTCILIENTLYIRMQLTCRDAGWFTMLHLSLSFRALILQKLKPNVRWASFICVWNVCTCPHTHTLPYNPQIRKVHLHNHFNLAERVVWKNRREHKGFDAVQEREGSCTGRIGQPPMHIHTCTHHLTHPRLKWTGHESDPDRFQVHGKRGVHTYTYLLLVPFS